MMNSENNSMTASFRSFLQDESGATAIEYGLIAALISVAAIAAMGAMGDSLQIQAAGAKPAAFKPLQSGGSAWGRRFCVPSSVRQPAPQALLAKLRSWSIRCWCSAGMGVISPRSRGRRPAVNRIVGPDRYRIVVEAASHHTPRPGSLMLRRANFERHG